MQDHFAAAGSVAARVRAVHYAAIAAPLHAPTPSDTSLFRQAVADAAQEVREAAILATGYIGWPDLIPLLEDLRDQDAVAAIRQSAARMLEGLRRHPPP